MSACQQLLSVLRSPSDDDQRTWRFTRRMTIVRWKPSLWVRLLPILVCLLWGGNVVAIRLSLRDTPPLRSAAIRFGLAAVLLLGWARLFRYSLVLPRRHAVPLMILGVLTIAVFGLLHWALNLARAAEVAILLYLYPLFTALLARLFLSEPLSLRSAVGVALGFAGAAVTLSSSHGPAAATTSLIGAGLAVLSALLWAVSTICAKRLLSATDRVLVMFYPTVVPAFGLGLASMVTESVPKVTALQASTLLALLYQGVLAGAVCSILWITLMERLPVGLLSYYTFLTPVFGVAFGSLFLDEPVSPHLVLGLGLVVLGLLAVQRPLSRSFLTERPAPGDVATHPLQEPAPTRSPGL